MSTAQRQEIALYLENAHEMLKAAQVMLDNDFYTSAINRAYYAIFYAANALLVTKGVNQKKHSGVIAAFRQHFVKTGLIDTQFSDSYGRVMGNRHSSDYELDSTLSKSDAIKDLEEARHFVAVVAQFLARGD